MEKVFVGFSVFILIIGVILATSYNIQQKVDKMEGVDDQKEKWTVSGFFEENEKVGLYFVQPKDWSFGPYPELGDPLYSKHFMINVTNEDTGQFTLFKVILAVPRSEIPPQPPYSFILTIYDVEVEQQNGAMITGTHPKHTGQLIALGAANNSGRYRVETELIPNVVIDENGKPKLVSPPIQLVLYKVSTSYVTPYTFLLPTGLIIISCGVSLLIYGLRRKPRGRRRKLKFSK